MQRRVISSGPAWSSNVQIFHATGGDNPGTICIPYPNGTQYYHCRRCDLFDENRLTVMWDAYQHHLRPLNPDDMACRECRAYLLNVETTIETDNHVSRYCPERPNRPAYLPRWDSVLGELDFSQFLPRAPPDASSSHGHPIQSSSAFIPAARSTDTARFPPADNTHQAIQQPPHPPSTLHYPLMASLPSLPGISSIWPSQHAGLAPRSNEVRILHGNDLSEYHFSSSNRDRRAPSHQHGPPVLPPPINLPSRNTPTRTHTSWESYSPSSRLPPSSHRTQPHPSR